VNIISRLDLQRELEKALEELKKVMRQGYELRVVWIPKGNCRVSGEVKGRYIYVYDDDGEVALETLKHEFIDHMISRVAVPYRDLTNQLISLINEIAYRRKERIVEALCELIKLGNKQ